MSSRFSGKSIIVTGAARGIGLAAARRFVRAGGSVMMVDNDEDRLSKEVEALSGEGYEGQATGFHADVREKLALNNLLAATLDAYEGLHVLFNGARTVLSSDPLDAGADAFERAMHINVTANLRLSQLVARRMIEYAQEEAPEPVDRAIVNISSVVAQRSLPRYLAYSVSSAAVEQITRSLAYALSEHRIRVNAVAVGGLVSTEFGATLPDVEDPRGAMRDLVPLGRLGEDRDVAEAVLFLASPLSRFTTGQILTVDGGRMLTDPLGQSSEG